MPAAKGEDAFAEIDTWDDKRVAKECKPVLVYYYCAPITDASNPNWAFARKVEMQCFTRKENNELLKKQFSLEKVGIDYKLKTIKGKPVIEPGKKPVAKRWDYRVAKVVLCSFDGEKTFATLSAKQTKSPYLKSANFGKLLKQVVAKNDSYLKKLQKAAAKARKAGKKA